MTEILAVVLDTNVLTSALIDQGGQDGKIVNRVLEKQARMFVTNQIAREYADVFERTYTNNRFTKPMHMRRLNKVVDIATLMDGTYYPGTSIQYGPDLWIEDLNDIKFISAAYMATSFLHDMCYLVTHDHHLLSLSTGLSQYNISSILPEDFLRKRGKY